jgi:anti-sigma regulatory factor (Ser/Thr protein kinase)
MSLPATPQSVRTARRFVAERVQDRSDDVIANAVLLTSELATNCVVHARSDFVLRVVVDVEAVRIELVDDDPGLPRRDAGRGILLVDELSTDWGVEPSVDGPGKVVWFEIEGS